MLEYEEDQDLLYPLPQYTPPAPTLPLAQGWSTSAERLIVSSN